MHNKISVKDIVEVAVLTAILFVQEEILSFLPNISLTVFSIVLYSKKEGLLKSLIIVTLHVLLDNLVMGSFNLTIMPFMWLGWIVIPITINLFFKKVESPIILGLLGIMYSLIYCWLFIIPSVFILHVNFIHYLFADLPFEGLLAASSFLSILWLYKPSAKALDKILGNEEII